MKSMWHNTREELLMKEIQAQLQIWKSKNFEFKADDYNFQMCPNKWAEILAWAELGLRDYVITQRNYINNEAASIKPMILQDLA